MLTTSSKRGERGFAIVMVALSLTVLLGIAAFAIDLGQRRQVTRHEQSGADAAALAGALELPNAGVASASMAATARSTAAQYAVNSLFDGTPPALPSPTCTGNTCVHVVNDITITVTTPYTPPSGLRAGVNAHNLIYVQACQPGEMFFGKFLGESDGGTLCRDATARRVNQTGGFGFGLVAMNDSDCPAMRFRGDSSTVLTSNGAVMVNSACPSETTGALDASGVNWTLEASYIGVVGQATLAPCAPEDTTVCTETTPSEGIAHFTDPLGTLAEPAVPATTRTCPSGSGFQLVEPGFYANGCNFNGNATFVFRPGLYYFDEGFSSNGGAALVCHNTATSLPLPADACDGVTFFMRTGTSTMNGSARVFLPAPTSGTYDGISLFQSRTNTSTLTINGTTDFDIGTIYAPNALSNFGGSGEVHVTGLVIGDVVDIGGTFNFLIDVPEDSPATDGEDDVGLEL